MISRIGAFLRDEEGQGMVEYGLIVGLISVMLIGGLIAMKGSLSSIFGTASGELDTAATSGS